MSIETNGENTVEIKLNEENPMKGENTMGNDVMTKEEYFKAVAEAFIGAYKELSLKVHKLGETEVDAMMHVNNEISEIYPCHGDEQAYLYNGDLEAAYYEYEEQAEPEHIYEVYVNVGYSGYIRVHAKDEDEAGEYVSDNIYNNGTELYMSDDEKVVDDFEWDDFSLEWDTGSVNDTGDVYTED